LLPTFESFFFACAIKPIQQLLQTLTPLIRTNERAKSTNPGNYGVSSLAQASLASGS
jgi:hypothetical protein